MGSGEGQRVRPSSGAGEVRRGQATPPSGSIQGLGVECGTTHPGREGEVRRGEARSIPSLGAEVQESAERPLGAPRIAVPRKAASGRTNKAKRGKKREANGRDLFFPL